MTAKEFLNQAIYLDESIQTKMQQIDKLHTLATKATSVLSLAGGHTGESRKMENIIIKIVTLENELDETVEKMITLKSDIRIAIVLMDDDQTRLILEKRYLNHEKWEKIAAEMCLSKQTLFRLHEKALKEIKIPQKYQMMRVNESK